LRDERLGRSHDFSSKRGVVHSEVMLPEDGMPKPHAHVILTMRSVDENG
jgi:hypothetical protein